MTEHDAIELLRPALRLSARPQIWAELGAGSGVFTSALSTLLAAQSTIHAIDLDRRSLSAIRLTNTNVHLDTNVSDMRNAITAMSGIDGILMANSLHYIEHQKDFLIQLKKALKSAGMIVVVEYDRIAANPWVPFPVSYAKLSTLAEKTGWSVSEKLASHPSRFGNGDIYTVVLYSKATG